MLELWTIDLIPKDAMERLRAQFEGQFDALARAQRLILATAATEQFVTHARMLSICDLHPTDLTRTLQGLVQDGYLEQSGRTRGAVYRLPGTALPSPDAVFPAPAVETESMAIPGKGSELGRKGSELPSEGANLNSEPLPNALGRQVDGLAYPLVDPLDSLDRKLLRELRDISSLVRGSGKVPRDISQKVVVLLCTNRYLTIRVLSALLKRDEDYLRQRILNPMVEEKVLARAFPQAPNDPRQAYTARIEPELASST